MGQSSFTRTLMIQAVLIAGPAVVKALANEKNVERALRLVPEAQFEKLRAAKLVKVNGLGQREFTTLGRMAMYHAQDAAIDAPGKVWRNRDQIADKAVRGAGRFGRSIVKSISDGLGG